MISIDSKWILERVGVQMDPETAELVAVFLIRLREAPDKNAFVKECLRRALEKK